MIEWTEKFESSREVHLLVDEVQSVPRIGARPATVDDLRHACEAAGLALVDDVVPGDRARIETMLANEREFREKAEARAQENAQSAANLARERNEMELRWRGIYATLATVRAALGVDAVDLGAEVKLLRARAEKAEDIIDDLRTRLAEAEARVESLEAEVVCPAFARDAALQRRMYEAARSILEAKYDETLVDAACRAMGMTDLWKAKYRINTNNHALLTQALTTGLAECDALRARLAALTAPANDLPLDDLDTLAAEVHALRVENSLMGEAASIHDSIADAARTVLRHAHFSRPEGLEAADELAKALEDLETL
jgi:chromosome segregation ATPase